MKTPKILIPVLSAAVLISCSGSSSSPSAESLKETLRTASCKDMIMYGHQDALMYGHSWKAAAKGKENPEENLFSGLDKSDVKDVCGSHPAVLGFDLGGIETGSPANLDGCPFDLMRKAASLHYERGGIVTFSWHLRNPLTGGDSWDVSSKEVVASVLEGGREHGTMLEWLSACADFLSSIRDSKGNVIPVIFRPWHEHTGSWFWWGQDLCTPEQYVALWNMTYSYLVKERGLTNLVWAYSPGAGVDMKGYMERYPGDETVDVLGLDCYQYVAWPADGRDSISHNVRDSLVKASIRPYMEQIGTSLAFMQEIAARHGKTIALTETGLEGIPYEKWWTEVLHPAIKSSGIAYVLTWRNACDRPEHFYSAYPGAACEQDFKEFCRLPDIVLLDEMSSLHSRNGR